MISATVETPLVDVNLVCVSLDVLGETQPTGGQNQSTGNELQRSNKKSHY